VLLDELREDRRVDRLGDDPVRRQEEEPPDLVGDDATFDRSAAAFDNPDFVDVVIQSYRHRFGLVPGDPALAGIDAALAAQPPITVPTLTFDGADDGVRPPAPAVQHGHRFTGARTHTVVPGVGHNMPQEVPGLFADAVLQLVQGAWPGRLR